MHLWRSRSVPAWDLPKSAGEGLEGKTGLGPLAAWLAGAVEGAEAGVDGSLVGFWAELVEGADGWGVGAVFAVWLLV